MLLLLRLVAFANDHATEVTPLLAVVYFPQTGLPNQMQDLVKAGANIGSSLPYLIPLRSTQYVPFIGCVIGQLLFGFLGDQFGRKTVYGKELMVIILATIICISVPSYFSGNQVLIWIFVTRIILGIGIGGDYPMSATVVSGQSTSPSWKTPNLTD